MPDGLDTLMDTLLGSDSEAPLAQSGESCATLAGKFDDEQLASQMIATYVWWSVVHSRILTEILHRVFGDPIAQSSPVPLVVLHAGQTRFSLLLVAPGYTGAARKIWLRPRRSERFVRIRAEGSTVDVAPRLVADAVRAEFGRRPAIHAGGIARQRGFGTGLVVRAVHEVLDEHRLGVAVVRPPYGEPGDDCVKPANGGPAVGASLAGSSSIRGVVGFTGIANGDLYGITARHPLIDGNPEVAGEPARIIWADELTDSYVLGLPKPGPAATDVNGPMTDSVPSLRRENRFFGVGSSWKYPRLSAYSPDIVHPRQDTAVSLFGEPDWMPGDCGASLMESPHDQVIAFSRGPATFSTAEQPKDDPAVQHASGGGGPVEQQADGDSSTEFHTHAWVWAAQVLARFDQSLPRSDPDARARPPI